MQSSSDRPGTTLVLLIRIDGATFSHAIGLVHRMADSGPNITSRSATRALATMVYTRRAYKARFRRLFQAVAKREQQVEMHASAVVEL